MLFPQPQSLTISEDRQEVDAACGNCGAQPVFRYRVVTYRGWERVTKCPKCLSVMAGEPLEPPVQSGQLK